MTNRRSEAINYTTQCTICIDYEESGAGNRIVYERPQMKLPNRPLTTADLLEVSKYQDDEALTTEAKAIFSDLKSKGSVGTSASLRSIFIARTAASALEMNL